MQPEASITTPFHMRGGVTKSYQLNVTRVLKEVDILASETQATIARINAQAQREANVIVNSAAAEVRPTPEPHPTPAPHARPTCHPPPRTQRAPAHNYPSLL
eukprot:scaffold3025_cov132-Isochrysis_galbana.AAC.1